MTVQIDIVAELASLVYPTATTPIEAVDFLQQAEFRVFQMKSSAGIDATKELERYFVYGAVREQLINREVKNDCGEDKGTFN